MHIFWLSLLQSITEFLPVSSSGHLILLPFFMHWKQQGIALDIGMHIGTVLAVCVYFYSDIVQLLKSLFCKKMSKKFLVNLVVATLPALVFGFLFAPLINKFCRTPLVVAIMLIVFGILLWLADKYSTSRLKIKQMSLKQALLIGLSQCLSFIPGVSRSGSTMTVARLCGFNRSDATHFSMLLSIPTVGAAGVWLFYKSILKGTVDDLFNLVFFEGVVFSFVGGVIVVYFLMNFVKRHSFFAFMIYRVVLGIFVILYCLKDKFSLPSFLS